MIAVILHPGEMGISVAAAAIESGHRVLWVSEGRSEKTKKRAEVHNLEDVGHLTEVCGSDIIFSICPPQVAIETAENVSEIGFGGLYVDANAGSPERKRIISEILKRKNIDFVDAGIIGLPAISEGSTRMYVSGERSEEVEKFFSDGFLGVKSIGSEIGKAAALKIAYGAWTKGSSALILAVRAMAKSSGVEEDLLKEWAVSQPNAEAMTLLSASLNPPKAWRFVSEMHEISKTFEAENIPNAFWDAAAEVYERLKEFKDLPEDQFDIDTVLWKLIEANEDI
ncbi:MAG: phosphogluconate dehydrogenase [Actinobacteria bacterium]|nr:phosphogluconate dehydrogenase [Actinomycetota bacterium]